MSGTYLDLWRAAGRAPQPGRSGSLPAPLDAMNGSGLAGAEHSRILPFLKAEDLLTPTTAGFAGGFEIEKGTLVGGEIHARLRVRATKEIKARGALVLVKGYRIREESRSETHKRGSDTVTENWVEVFATELEAMPLIEVPLPATLAVGDEIDLKILAPAPRLGPPSVHAGELAIVWTMQATWDIPLGGDERVAAIVSVAQHPDIVRSGVMALGPSAMMGEWSTGSGTLNVTPAPPLAPGTTFSVHVRWPDASGGRGARVELYVDIKNAWPMCIASVKMETAALVAGVDVQFEIPADAPPVFDMQNITLRYRIRALVDLPLRPDIAIERNVAIG
jgi:hypothetical protein